MKKRTKRLLAVPAIGIAFMAEELYRYVFCRKSSALFSLLFDTKGHEENYYRVRDAAADRFRKRYHEEYTMKSARGEELKGFYYPFGAKGKKIAFIIHGYRSEHADTAGLYYEYYKKHGIDVFCCDHTASGESKGKYIGFDILETKDCLKWIDFLKEKFGDDIQIILHGFSMGGATVMQMSSACPSNVKFIIEDSGYKNAKASLEHQVGILYQPLRWMNKIFAGYDLDDSDVVKSLEKSKIPMLFVHGRDDKLVPFENGPELYEMYQGEKDCFFPSDTRHIESMYTSPELYAEKIDCFIEKYFEHKEK